MLHKSYIVISGYMRIVQEVPGQHSMREGVMVGIGTSQWQLELKGVWISHSLCPLIATLMKLIPVKLIYYYNVIKFIGKQKLSWGYIIPIHLDFHTAKIVVGTDHQKEWALVVPNSTLNLAVYTHQLVDSH